MCDLGDGLPAASATLESAHTGRDTFAGSSSPTSRTSPSGLFLRGVPAHGPASAPAGIADSIPPFVHVNPPMRLPAKKKPPTEPQRTDLDVAALLIRERSLQCSPLLQPSATELPPGGGCTRSPAPFAAIQQPSSPHAQWKSPWSYMAGSRCDKARIVAPVAQWPDIRVDCALVSLRRR